MASQRFLLLVNNLIIRDDQNNPIMEIQENGTKYYSNGKDTQDLSDRVAEVMNSILDLDTKNPLFELVSKDTNLVRYNQDFRIKMIITPLYELQLQLANNPDATRIAGSLVDIQEVWREQMYEFYVVEFMKYTQIMSHLETMVKIRRPKVSPFKVRHGEHRIMDVLYVKVNGLFNPLDTIPGLDKTKLFKQIYGREEHTANFSLDDPAVFQVNILRGAVECYFATSSDILKLCGVNYKDTLSSRDIYRLVAALCLKNLFPTTPNGNLHQGILSFPVGKTLYQMVDPVDRVPVRYFEDPAAAARFAEDEGYDMMTLDTDAMFIKSAFPSFKNKNITQETPLLHQIRGAEFVY